jgi:hypothetical protein
VTARTIEVIVGPQGQTRLETKGFAGASCKDASRFIENVLGRKVSEQATAEMHLAANEKASRTEHA